MKRLLFPVILISVLMSGIQQSYGQEYSCFNCIIVNDCWMCLMMMPSGGVTCCTPSCYVCTLTGICPAGGGGCFLPGTMVRVEDGFKAIERIKVGDSVIGLGKSDRLVPCDVVKTYVSIQCDYYVINGKLMVTGTHPFLVDEEWVEASKIKLGSELQGIDHNTVVVTSIELVHKPVRTYNIEVADTHTFFVEGILVHNKGPDPGLN